MPVIAAIRRHRPGLPICAYGLYAPLNQPQLAAAGVQAVLGPEAEADLVEMARQAQAGVPLAAPAHAALPRIAFRVPDRQGLPPLTAYARLQRPDGRQAIVGATEATRGCKHRCRHCPIVPVYDGRFRVVPVEVVLADIRAQVEAGAEHITFGDPDFLNGPIHARRIVDALHAEWPSLTYDVIAKVEHLRQHDALLPVLRDTGCAFVTTAVESLDDAGAGPARQGPHARRRRGGGGPQPRARPGAGADVHRLHAVDDARRRSPRFLDDVEALDLVEHVAPVQWTLRLLVTWESRLLELDDVRGWSGRSTRPR